MVLEFFHLKVDESLFLPQKQQTALKHDLSASEHLKMTVRYTITKYLHLL